MKLEERMKNCKLEIHPEKTRIVYCRSDKYNEEHEDEAFIFLGYSFRRRTIKSKYGNLFNGFTPAVSESAGNSLKEKIRTIRKIHKTIEIEELANLMNPIIRGWYNYFSKFSASEAKRVLEHVNFGLARWIRRKYKNAGNKGKSFTLLGRIAQREPQLFYHWQIGIVPTIG